MSNSAATRITHTWNQLALWIFAFAGFRCLNSFTRPKCIPEGSQTKARAPVFPSPPHLRGQCRGPASDSSAPGPVSRATTSCRWPHRPGPPDVSEGQRPRSATSAWHVGRRPGLFFRKPGLADRPTWKERRAVSRSLSLPRPPLPSRPCRPPEARTREHRPRRLALHQAGARPQALGGPRLYGQLTAPLASPTLPRPVRPAPPQDRTLWGAFPAPQPLGLRATFSVPVLRPSFRSCATTLSARAHCREPREWASFQTLRPERCRSGGPRSNRAPSNRPSVAKRPKLTHVLEVLSERQGSPDSAFWL